MDPIANPYTPNAGSRPPELAKGLIYATEDYGFIDFTVPRFAEFMRRT